MCQTPPPAATRVLTLVLVVVGGDIVPHETCQAPLHMALHAEHSAVWKHGNRMHVDVPIWLSHLHQFFGTGPRAVCCSAASMAPANEVMPSLSLVHKTCHRTPRQQALWLCGQACSICDSYRGASSLQTMTCCFNCRSVDARGQCRNATARTCSRGRAGPARSRQPTCTMQWAEVSAIVHATQARASQAQGRGMFAVKAGIPPDCNEEERLLPLPVRGEGARHFVRWYATRYSG